MQNILDKNSQNISNRKGGTLLKDNTNTQNGINKTLGPYPLQDSVTNSVSKKNVQESTNTKTTDGKKSNMRIFTICGQKMDKNHQKLQQYYAQ